MRLFFTKPLRIPRVFKPSWQHYTMWRARPVADEIRLADLIVNFGEPCGEEQTPTLSVSNQGVENAPEGTLVIAEASGVEVGRVSLPALYSGTTASGIPISVVS